MKEHEIDNALVQMKGRILTRIHNADEPGDFLSLAEELQDLLELWGLLGYAYKGAELCGAMDGYIRTHIANDFDSPRAMELALVNTVIIKLRHNYHLRQQKYREDQVKDAAGSVC